MRNHESQPAFSIISVIKNIESRRALFCRSVESVLNQTFDDFEFIIQDGGSTDNTLEILSGYNDKRIRVYSELDSVHAEGMFRAFRKCRGKYIGSCWSDEELLPNDLKKALCVFENNPNIAAFYGNYWTVNAEGDKSGPFVSKHPFSIQAYVCQSLVPPFCSSFFSREFLERAGVHDHSWRYGGGEFEFWIRLANVGPILYVPSDFSCFGKHSQSDTGMASLYDRLTRERAKVMPELFEENRILRDSGVTVEQAIAGNYAWAAESVFGIEGLSARYRRFVEIVRSYDSGNSHLPCLIQRLELARPPEELGGTFGKECDAAQGTVPGQKDSEMAGEETRCDSAVVAESSFEAPYLSIVVATRNDDHGGDMLGRFQSFLDHLAEMCDRHRLAAELIVVEWNPDPDRLCLTDAVRWPKSAVLDVRIVTVPAHIHAQYENADKFPLFQMIAKNVGVRRARGEFVLATNVDLLFSDELCAFLAGKGLDPACFYRIDRHDLAATSVPEGLDWEQRQRYCERRVVRVHGQHGTYAWGQSPPGGRPDRLHTHACGDFTLMSRRKWLELRGYPEFHLWSIYLDGLLIHAAAAAGLRQVILRDPCRIYHIEHDLGWARTKESAKERPCLDYDSEYLPLCRKMLAEGKPLDVNGAVWGLADVDLEETRPTTVAELPTTPEELKNLIRRECPGLDEKLGHGDIHGAVDILRDWTSRNAAVSDEVKLIRPANVIATYRSLSGQHGGMWCGGIAIFHTMILDLFGIPATPFGYAYCRKSSLSHMVTLFADTRSASPRFYISDAYFNLDYRDAASGSPLEAFELFQRIGRHEYETIFIRERPAVRPCVVQVGTDPSGCWFYPNGDAGIPQRQSDRWIYSNARLTVASLANLDPTWRRGIAEHRGNLTPTQFLFQLMLLNQKFYPFPRTALTQALTEQFDRCRRALSVPRAHDAALQNRVGRDETHVGRGQQVEDGAQPSHRDDEACQSRAIEPFGCWIETLASLDNRLYYRDQSAQTLSSLAQYAGELDPTVIVELGTLAGLSLRTWVASTQRAKIYAVDLSFDTLRETMQSLPVDLSRVTLLEQDILKTDFSCLWTAQDRVIFFVDAHDLPGVPIMEYVLTKALPALPDGSLVIVDDLWFSAERLTRDNAQAFLDGRVVGEIDELQCFEGHYAPYHKGGSFMGFAEVVPLLEFVNRYGIQLTHDKSGKHVSFVWRQEYLSRCNAAGAVEPGDYCGSVLYNPLASVRVRPALKESMHRIAHDYRQNRIAQVAESLTGLMKQHPDEPGLAYGLAVCCARCGQLDQARNILGRVVHDTSDPHCRRLFEDLVERVGPCEGLEPKMSQHLYRGAQGLTIFAMPKAFTGHNALIQKNAIRSWARLEPRPEILLFGGEPGIREMAEEVGARHIPQVDRNEFGTPLVNKLFEAAEVHASHGVLAYVNADMILFQDFADGVRKVRTQRSHFLLIGQRWDIPVLEEIDFRQPCWQRSLQEQMAEHAMLHAECGLDYFVFPKGLYREIPPFAIGRTAWDNWLVMAPHARGVAVIDGTEFITAVHQDHDYGHVAGGREEAWRGVEAARNRELAGPPNNSGRTSGATWILNREGMLLRTPPRQPVYLTAQYRQERSAWLLKQAARLTAAGQGELAACKWEESLGQQEALIALRGPSDSPSDSTEDARLVQGYATLCMHLARCQAQMGRYERAAATCVRLLENPRISIPAVQRDKLIRQRDQWAHLIGHDRVSVAAPPDPESEQARGCRPKVTVVTACRNAEGHLAECLDSILGQTLQEWELFLLDDGSTDGTRRIMEDYAGRDGRIRAFHFDDSRGPYVRRNFAIARARADFIVIHDADDIMCPDKLQRLHAAILEDERLGLVGSFYRCFLDECTTMERTEPVVLPTTHEEILAAYQTQHIWDFSWHASAIVRRDLFDVIGLYDENPFGADSFWLAKAAEYARHTGRIRLKNIPEFLTLRRIHANSQTGRLPTSDHRSPRVAYVQYCQTKLQDAVRRVGRDPRIHLARALRECTCGDFFQQWENQAAVPEKRPVDAQAVDHLLQRARQQFRARRYVACVRTLRGLQVMDPTIPHRVAHFDLVMAMALYGLGHKERSRICLRREMGNHDSPVAGQLYEDLFVRGMRIDVVQWYTEHAEAIALQIQRSTGQDVSSAANVDVVPMAASDRRPQVTVITACRNAEGHLAECLDSILGQTLQEWELFLLDDGSTDGTRRIMEDYAGRDGRIRAFHFDDSRGPYVRRNFAIERARADFIVIHDADDIMCPTKLETLYNEINSDANLAMVGSNYRMFLEEYRGLEYSEASRLPLTNNEILDRFRSWQHGMSHGSAILRKSLFAEIGLYDENPFAADPFWSAKLALYAESGQPVRVKNVPECLTLIRVHDANHTRLLSTLDPRNRRIRYRQYAECKLRRIRERVRSQPGVDIGWELRQCTCADFLTRFKAQIIAWENAPLDARLIQEYLQSAVHLFNQGHFVTCVNILNSTETFEPTLADRVVGYDLLRGLAYFALQMERRARFCLDREIHRHDTLAARRFVEDAFESGRSVDVPSWCQEHAARYDIGLKEAGPKRSPQMAPSARTV